MSTLAAANYGNMAFDVAGSYSPEYTAQSKCAHHETLKIIYVEKGNCEISIHLQENHNARTVTVPAYNFIVINAGVQHSVQAAGDASCKLKTLELMMVDAVQGIPQMQLGQMLCHMQRLHQMLNENWPYMVLCDTTCVSRVMTAISQLYEKHCGKMPAEKRLLLHLKINELLLLLDDCGLVSSGKGRGAGYIRKAQQIIREQLFSPDLSPEKVAEEIGITKNYLMALFQKELGHTVMHEIQTLRIEQACSRILNSDETLLDIGFACGFNARQSFYSNFKKYTGLSPSKFRAKHLQLSAGSKGRLTGKV